MDLFKVISDLTAAAGVSGNERGVAAVAEGYFRTFTDDVWRDAMGNLFARVGKGEPVILFSAHMDEIGMMVKAIEDNGMLRICSVAGVDPRVLPGSEVRVFGREPVTAIVGATPPHLLSEEDAKAAYKIDDLVCDTGLPAGRVKEVIAVGDFVSFAPIAPMKLQSGLIAGKTFDDRALVAGLIEVLDLLKDRKLNCTVICCASVQEERGCLGAITAAYGADPDLAVAVDVCHAPTPGADAADTVAIDKLAITAGSNIHPAMFTALTGIAAEHHIDYEVDACMGHSGTDAWEIQIQRKGVPTGLVSLPLRYMHTSVEVISLGTLKNCARVLAEFAASLNADWEEKICYRD